MRRWLPVAALLLCIPVATAAEPAKPCASPEAHAFDFWIGDWNVVQKIHAEDGTWLTLPAQTSVRAAMDGCALVEEWRGDVQFFWEGMTKPEPMAGLSVRAYDPRSHTWSIRWMDTRSPRFKEPYVGTIANGHGTFFRTWKTPRGKRTGRITFTRVSKDAVTWALATSADGGKTWEDVWTMAMTRK